MDAELQQYWIAQVAEVRALISKHTEVSAPAETAFVVQNSITVGASVRAVDPVQPMVTVSTGALQFIQSLLREACQKEHFFVSHSAIDKHALLMGLGLQWILLHELAHWLLGHCGASTQQGLDEQTQHLVVFGDEAVEVLSDAGRKYLELQADGVAFELMLHYAVFADEPTGGVWAWIGSWDDPKLTDVDVITQKIRTITVAGACVVLVMEQMRRAAGLSSAYPLPLTRLTNMVATALRVMSDYLGTTREVPDGRLVMDGDAYRERGEIFANLEIGLAGGLLDAAIIANVLKVEDVLFGGSELSVGESLTAIDVFSKNLVFLQNLQQYMADLSFCPEPKAWNAASFAEYIALHEMKRVVDPVLRDYALIDF
ncbi:MAG: hypothetical protein RLZZ215_683 [Pseudomonadota bacterium]|jgi:hypothetical protein